MRSICLLFYLLLSFSFLWAQPKNDFQTLIYQISPEEYIELEKGAKLNEKYLHTLIDSTFLNFSIPDLGYYIKAYPDAEALQLEVVANTSISALLIQNDKDFGLRVMDSLGRDIVNAQVFWEEKLIPFHQKSKTYRLKKWKEKKGKVMVKVGQEVLFFDAQHSYDYYHRYARNLKYHLLGPVRFFKRIWWKAKNVIVFGEWFPNKEYKGYIAFSQPKYRPNDTLKIKAYLTNKKGKPLNRPLELELKSNWRTKYETTLKPIKKGVYIAEIPLVDSLDLTLDKRAQITFYDDRLFNEYDVKSHDFYFEDYQLDDVVYSLKTDKEKYEYGEKVTVLADGKFKTGQFIPDGTIRLTILTTNKYRRLGNYQFFDKKVLVKDTLWTTELPLSSQKTTQILIPNDSVPKIEIPIYIHAVFTNANGEIHTKKTTFYIKKPAKFQPLQLSLEEEYIVAKVKESIDNQHPIVEWYVYNDDIDNVDATRLVKLPYKEKVNGNLSGYDISYPDSSDLVELMLEDEPSKVFVAGKHSGKNVHIQLANPRQLPITYQLYAGKNLLEEGLIQHPKYALNQKANSNKIYYLKCQYVWAGKTIEEIESFIFLKKALTIEIEQPETIIPGEQIPIKIKVQNQQKRGIKGVNLTAGSVNGKFDSSLPFSDIQVDYKAGKNPRAYKSYEITDKEELLKNRLNMSKNWAIKTKVDTQLFYQLRYAESGVFMRYDTITKDTFYQNLAQFSPYLVDKGRALPIYMIFCNKKLVYYYDVDDNPQYAFIGQAGYNKIEIRTREAHYDIDSVFLKKGQKLEFSIDVNRFVKSKSGLKIQRKSANKFLMPFEKDLIKNSTFVFFPAIGKHHLLQDSTNIHIFNTNYADRKQNFRIGPFYHHQDLTYILKDQFSNTFDFEPNISYKISENRERLYEYKWLKNKDLLPKSLPLKQPAQSVYSLADIQAFTPKSTKPKIIFNQISLPNDKPIGKVKFNYEDKEKELLAILWKPKFFTSFTVHPNKRVFQDSPGNYKLILLKKDSTYAQTELSLTAHALLFLDLNDLTFQRDSLGLIRQQIGYDTTSTLSKNSIDFPKNRTTEPIILDNFSGTLRGTITDDTGEPLIGASVLIKGTAMGTVTDIDGSYSLAVPDGEYEIVVAYTGYATQEVHINQASKTVDVVLSGGVALEEVVVTGYGISKKEKALSASVATVTSDALQGKIAGVSISEEKKQKRLSLINKNLPAGDQLRSNFQDHAFWQPNLITDSKGEAYFTATFPDNLTQWQTFVIGMDKKRRAGVSFANTNAFKPLVAQLTIPRFLVEGDETDVIGKAINFTPDSLTINTLFKKEGDIIAQNSAIISDALIEKTSIQTTPEKDTLTLIYQLKNGEYGDGEERKIPVFKKGIIENTGQFYLLDSDTSFSIEFADKNTPVTIRVESNLFDLLTQSVDYLIEYPHGCNEQTASKLMGVLLAKEIKMIQGQRFKKERYIKKGIERLEKAQNDNGSWGWFQADKPNAWMCTYVLKVLHQAKQAGYPSKSLEKGLTFLTNSLPQFKGRDLLNTLELLTDIGQNADYKKWLQPLDTLFHADNLNAKFTLLKIKQVQNLPHSLDSLYQYQQTDIFGNAYWGQSNYHWYNTDIQISLLAYEILKKAEKTDLCKGIEHYLLRQKDLLGWGNTFQTAKVLTTILKNNFNQKDSTTQISSFTLTGDKPLTINQFPFDTTFESGANIRLSKTGKAPIYFSAYQTYFNANPSPKSDLFVVKSSLKQKGDSTTNLTATVAAQLEVKVEMKRKAEYVMIEIPIPAGCSYGEKTQPVSWWNYRRYVNNYEVHREYYKDKVAIFCRELPIGNYIYTINLEPRFTGKYTLNPAKVEEMYFPVFYGRNEIKSVAIQE